MSGTIYTAIVGTKDGPKYRLAHRDEEGNLSYVNDTIYDTIQEADDAAEQLAELEPLEGLHEDEEPEDEQEPEHDYIGEMLDGMMLDDLMHNRPILPPVTPPQVKPINWEELEV